MKNEKEQKINTTVHLILDFLFSELSGINFKDSFTKPVSF